MNFDNTIFGANFDDMSSLTKEILEYAMCHFIPEVTKQKSGDNCPWKTLYEMCDTKVL